MAMQFMHGHLRYMLIHPGKLGEGMVSLTGQVLLVCRCDLASL